MINIFPKTMFCEAEGCIRKKEVIVDKSLPLTKVKKLNSEGKTATTTQYQTRRSHYCYYHNKLRKGRFDPDPKNYAVLKRRDDIKFTSI